MPSAVPVVVNVVKVTVDSLVQAGLRTVLGVAGASGKLVSRSREVQCHQEDVLSGRKLIGTTSTLLL